jgi:hypothetical protein
MTGLPHNLLMHLFLGQLIAGTVREDGDGNCIASIPIRLSELHVCTFFASVILSP